MDDITSKLNELKTEIERGKTEKTRAEANLESYTKQKDEIVTQMALLSVTPETIEAEIAKLDQEIAAGLIWAGELLRG